jgi:hypothetical protein
MARGTAAATLETGGGVRIALSTDERERPTRPSRAGARDSIATIPAAVSLLDDIGASKEMLRDETRHFHLEAGSRSSKIETCDPRQSGYNCCSPPMSGYIYEPQLERNELSPMTPRAPSQTPRAITPQAQLPIR